MLGNFYRRNFFPKASVRASSSATDTMSDSTQVSSSCYTIRMLKTSEFNKTRKIGKAMTVITGTKFPVRGQEERLKIDIRIQSKNDI